MTGQNPYSTPEASLDTEKQEYYQPKIISFDGRIGRLRYLAYGVGVNLILMLVLMPIMGGTMAMTDADGQSTLGMVAMALFYIATIVFSVMFGKRRLNDLNRSGWWLLLFFVPLINLAMTIYLVFFPGSDDINDYGLMPCENSLGVKILGWILPLVFVGGMVAAIAIPAYQAYMLQAQQNQLQQ